jgi:hypothetical protein
MVGYPIVLIEYLPQSPALGDNLFAVTFATDTKAPNVIHQQPATLGIVPTAVAIKTFFYVRLLGFLGSQPRGVVPTARFTTGLFPVLLGSLVNILLSIFVKFIVQVIVNIHGQWINALANCFV